MVYTQVGLHVANEFLDKLDNLELLTSSLESWSLPRRLASDLEVERKWLFDAIELAHLHNRKS